MQIVIEIPNWLYNAIMEWKEPHYSKSLGDAVRDGTPLPENATNGDMIKALFPNCYCRFGQDINNLIGDFATIVLAECGGYVSCQVDWWNAPHKPESEDKESESE